MTTSDTLLAPAQPTIFADLHARHGAQMSPFAGSLLPMQFTSITQEHEATRTACGLFDVSHMGQAFLTGDQAVSALEKLVPTDLARLQNGQMAYTVLLNDNGGIIDDLMVLKLAQNRLFLVVNASRKEVDFAHIRAHLPASVTLSALDGRGLLALQGPKAATILASLMPADCALPAAFMQGVMDAPSGLIITRSGYTGEDGFEISLPAEMALDWANKLSALADVSWCGLGARDTLRLEAGLCLYGQDLDEATSPVEANIRFVVSKRRREAADFIGAEKVLAQWQTGPARLRVGILPEGKVIARHGVAVFSGDGQTRLGEICSGGYSPTLQKPIAMAYVTTQNQAIIQEGSTVQLEVRGKLYPATICALPFVPHRYCR
jgi:aminomethyltransferase